MTDIAELGLAVRSDGVVVARDRLRSFSREASIAERAVAGLINKVGALVGAYATWRIIEATIGKFVNATVEAERAQQKLETVIKSTGGAAGLTAIELDRMAKGLQQVTTYGDETIKSGQALLLTFTRISREVFPDALEAAMNVATAMGTDLNNAILQVGKAINDPIVGMTALTRAGIQFTETQKEAIKGLVESNDLLGAQKIVLEELETQFGNSARAARGTLGGALTALGEAFDDLFEANGPASERLRQSVERLIDQLTSPSTIAAVQNVGAMMFDVFAGVLDTILKIISTVDRWVNQFNVGFDRSMDQWKDRGEEGARARITDLLSRGRGHLASEESFGMNMGDFFTPFRTDDTGTMPSFRGMQQSMGLGIAGAGGGISDEAQRQLDAYEKLIETGNRRAEQLSAEAAALQMTGFEGERMLTLHQLMADATATGIELDDTRIAQLEELAEKTHRANLAMEGAQVTMSNRTVFEAMFDEISRLNELLREGAISWDTYARAVGNTTASAISSVFGQLAGLSSALEEVFEENKAISIATAVLKGVESVASAYAAGNTIGGPLVGGIFAGIAAATAALNVAAVAGVTKNSRTMPSTGANAGGGANVSTPNNAQSRNVTVQIIGDRFSAQQVGSLADQLIEELGEKGQTVSIGFN